MRSFFTGAFLFLFFNCIKHNKRKVTEESFFFFSRLSGYSNDHVFRFPSLLDIDNDGDRRRHGMIELTQRYICRRNDDDEIA